ncbi:metal ABC transporter permease [Rothia nasimurium]|uniref:metal ABC transporter permease n=1 Tax=Rothia nasimurium TaxID=85336 RepID=UPI001F345685|nr:metal ABC transporter permease [Rothia nasimurium]
MYELFIEPLTYGFMQRGLLVTVLAALVCALLSCWLVLMGWSLMGDGISHAVLPGVALAYILGAPFALGALLAALVAVALIGSVAARRRVREDAAIGIVFTVMFALGLVLLSAFPSQVDLHSVIFGNVLGVSWADVWQIGLLAMLVVAVLLVKRRDLVLYAFDPGYTHAIGLSPRLLSSLLLVALALTSVLALQIVGVVLVVALLVIPGATARLLTDRFTSMLLISSAVSLLAALAGFFLAYLLDISAGGTVVLALGVLFGLAYLFAPRHGLLAAARARRAVEAGQG